MFFDLCAVAATKPTLDKLLTEMNDKKIEDWKIASYFFTLGNNIQTPENLKQFIVRRKSTMISDFAKLSHNL